MRFLVRKCLRRDWLCADHRVLGLCTDESGEPGSCPDCPCNLLDEAMATPLGRVVERAFGLMRLKDTGFPLPPADGLPADLVAAVEIIAEERHAYLDDQRSHEEELESGKREIEKAAKRG